MACLHNINLNPHQEGVIHASDPILLAIRYHGAGCMFAAATLITLCSWENGGAFSFSVDFHFVGTASMQEVFWIQIAVPQASHTDMCVCHMVRFVLPSYEGVNTMAVSRLCVFAAAPCNHSWFLPWTHMRKSPDGVTAEGPWPLQCKKHGKARKHESQEAEPSRERKQRVALYTASGGTRTAQQAVSASIQQPSSF